MDDERFDALVQRLSRVLPCRLSRRDAVGIGVAAPLAVGVGGAVDARRRRRRRPCGVCQTRRGRRCRPKPDGTGCDTCRVCLGGRCVAAFDGIECRECFVCGAGECNTPAADGTSCDECLVCSGGLCTAVAPDETACRSGGLCGSGRCFEPPVCLPFFAGCSPLEPEQCCSGLCTFSAGGPRCELSLEGDACQSNSDCGIGLTCRLFLCVIA